MFEPVMPEAPLPPDESGRLLALKSLAVLDSPPEAEFDALVQAAALVCGVPISLVSLVDEGRQWFKANVGLPGVTQTSRAAAFCGHAILHNEVLEVTDATADPRFVDNPLVTGDPGIRFYAGAPLELAGGELIGTLCVIDRQARVLTSTQRETLVCLAKAAAKALESRRLARAFVVSEARFRALSEAAPLGVFATDATGACTYTNSRWQALFGLGGPESLGQGWSRTLHPDDRAEVFHEWGQAALRRSDFDMHFRVRRDDGTVRYVRSIARPVLDEADNVEGFIGSVEDVTDRLLAERALRSERERLASIIEGTGAGTWEWNVLTDEARFNARWQALLGLPPESPEPATIAGWLERVHPDDADRLRTSIDDHLARRTEALECETRLRHQEGHWVCVLARGRVLTRDAEGRAEWMFGTHIDVTARKLQEESLRRSELLLRQTGRLAEVGGWEVDLSRQVVTWSDETCRIHGVDPGHRPSIDEALSFFPLETRSRIRAAFESSVIDGRPWDLELPFRRADGVDLWVRIVGAVEVGDGGRVRLLGAIQNVTQRVLQRQVLDAQNELLRVTLQSIRDAVVTTDAQGRVNGINPTAERMTGWVAEEVRGQALADVLRLVDMTTRQPVALLTDRGTGDAHTLLISRDGSEVGIEASASPIRGTDGRDLGAVLVFRDVTEQRRLGAEMKYRATHDGLTGLTNRVEFESRLARLVLRASSDAHVHALMFIDLDRFKLVNDTCGHTAGDRLLKQVATLLGESLRTRDTLARLGGDEFAVILEHCPTDDAVRIAQTLCDQLDDFRFVHEDRRFRIGASVGVVPVDRRWTSATALMQAADAACYAAKEAGRNRVHCWFDTDGAIRARQGESQWASRLAQAIDEDRFVLHAQRIASLGAPLHGLHAEVLLRMVDERGEMVSPGAFLPAAERFHLASRIDQWMLQRVITLLSALPDPGRVELLSVNLSGQSVGDRTFHPRAIDALVKAGPVVCGRLCIELTETAAVTHIADASSFIRELRRLGVRVALDDFGAGASSFGYLKSLPIDILKVDGQFVRDLLVDPLDDIATRCFVDVARVLGVQTVAEHVETPATFERVREIGFDFAQGFLIHRPEPVEVLLRQCATQAGVEADPLAAATQGSAIGG